jgi:hypothetical protein
MLSKLFKISIVFLLLSFSSSSKQIKNQIKDYDAFIDVLTQKEGTLDLHIPLDSIEAQLNYLKEEMKSEKTPIQLYQLFSKTTSIINCGHTQLQPTKQVIKEWIQARNSLPIDYILLGQKLFTCKIQKEDVKTISIGKTLEQVKTTVPDKCEIIAIDGKTVDEMMTKIGEFISSDENGMELKYFVAGQFFEFYRKIAYQEHQDSTAVVYVHKKDTIETHLFNGFPPLKTINKRLTDAEKQYKKNQTDIGKFDILKSKYGYFKFVSFKKCKGKLYEEFLEKSFKKLQKTKTKYLIIDVRGNGGGQMQTFLMSYLVGIGVKIGTYQVTKPKKRGENRSIKKFSKEYTNHKILSFSQKLALRANPDFDGTLKTPAIDDKLIFRGKVIVITDEGTFSASSCLASNLKALRNAKIAGHIAGGSFYTGNSGTIRCILPKSKLTLIVNPNTFHTTLEPSIDHQSVKLPDLIVDPIYPTSKKKDDWYLNKVIKLFKENF